MEPTRYGGICRRFLNGSCRFGLRCNYRHELPAVPSSQICKHFQKGGCWYGERCKYFHVLQPEVDTAAAGRRGSVPAVSSSSVAFAPPDRRGSEPAFLQSEEDGQHSRQECSRSEPMVNASNSQNTGHPTANIAEEPSQDTSSELAHSSRSAQVGACHATNEEESSSSEDGAAAAAASSTQAEETEAVLQSINVTCGICMDKVYEKTHRRNQVFGILPNCNHSFCLECIMTWRKTKDLGPDVVKSCPQCRVRSPFYVPSKYWVEGQAKENVIAAFKEKFSKKTCSYYTRYRCCPFKTECLYRHNKPAHPRSYQYPTEDDNDYEDEGDFLDLRNFFIAVTLLGDDDDVFDFLFT
ncbi:makorin, ring finger protein, 4 [Stegastes partitus]|uniref:RING-type E3 ubiquitin transferase n=1 Tax=Stegastes partitus TaxID=144197 RepID=A0A9Y4NB47_9TELE|nr:PREDICTED: E3 ubiquitin-protein ligase makorin-1-like [Stegastes partitus]